jgi:predicted RecB family nuclease
VPSYIRAGEKDDEGERARIMDEILRYNEEDLQATWAVFRWAEANQRIP